VTDYKIDPLHNLLFCRDQQISTSRGLVAGRLNSKARSFELDVMHTVFENLGFRFLDSIPEGETLEGGDFFMARHDLAMLAVGMRTSLGAAEYLM
jgi:arginine deiminase